MNYRKFGNTDLMVSEVGFGAWAIGGDAKVGNMPIGWGHADDETSSKAIFAALEEGINFFDTADFYGLGHSEKLLGQVLKNKEAIIATKVGHRAIDNTIVLDYSKDYILHACEKSLKQLNRDVIDYYQLHSAKLHHLQEGECIEAMELLKQQGKIRYWGLSLNTFNPSVEADYLMKRNAGDGFQAVFNVINQRALSTIKKGAEKNYGMIARMPLQFGLLTGKFKRDNQFPATDHRSFRLTPEILDQSLKILEEDVWPVAEAENLTPTQLAMSFILSYQEVSTVIPGIRTTEHVIQNTSGIKKLQEENRLFLESLSTKWESVLALMEKQG